MKRWHLNPRAAAAAALLGTGLAFAQAPAPLQAELGLAPALAVAPLLQGSAAQQSAGRLVAAEQAGLRQARAGSAEWVATTSVARVADAGPPAARSTDWELGIERALRLPGKAEAQTRAAQARVALAETQGRLLAREQAAALLRALVDWQREQHTAALWQGQAALMQAQAQAVGRRQRLGDAAEIEHLQAAMALEQAQAQAAAALARAAAAREFLGRRYPGLLAPAGDKPAVVPTAPDPASAGALPALEAWLNAARQRSPELATRRREAEALQAQARAERLEQRPDPTLGLRWGRARQGQEQTVGFVLSLPFGGEYRRAGAEATALRAAAAELQADDSAAAWQAEALRRHAQAQAARASWQQARLAQRQLDTVADRLAQGYALGEGSLADVLAARRLAKEQGLVAVNAAMDDLAARALLALEAGDLWPETGP